MHPGTCRFAVVVLVLAIVAPSTIVAATRFSFVAEGPQYSYRGVMTIDEGRQRVDVTEGNHPQYNENISIITREAGVQAILIDHSSRTWFQRELSSVAGPLATAHGIGASRLLGWRVWKTRQRLEDGGRATERHVVHAEYTIAMDSFEERLEAKITMRAEFDIVPSIRQLAHPWGLQFAAKTGFDKLDQAIARRIPDRLPLRQVVTASRRIAGGPLLSETITILLSDVVTLPPAQLVEFAPPAGYVYREPNFQFGR